MSSGDEVERVMVPFVSKYVEKVLVNLIQSTDTPFAVLANIYLMTKALEMVVPHMLVDMSPVDTIPIFDDYLSDLRQLNLDKGLHKLANKIAANIVHHFASEDKLTLVN